MSKMKSIVDTTAKSVSKVKAMVNSIEKQAMSSPFSTGSPVETREDRFVKVTTRRKSDLDPRNERSPNQERSLAEIEEVRSEARFAKVVARRKLDLVLDNFEDDNDGIVKVGKKKKTKVGNQTVTVNTSGEECDLDLEKQYGRSTEYCRRDHIRVHDPIKNQDDNGSRKDERLVYVDFKAGLFVAMKQKMIKTMTAMNMPLVGVPSVNKFGTKGAETRISFSSTFKVKSKKYKVKVKVHSTKCSMDFQGC